MVEPTGADRARDLAADLALCEAADRGPWVEVRRGLYRTIRNDRRPPAPGGTVIGWLIARTKHLQDRNAAFILAAREGWPAAIRRALAAEAEVASLQRIVNGLADRVAAQSALLSRRAEKKES